MLEVQDLTVDIRSGRSIVRPIEHISFALDVNETLGLVGESGCGKSTTLRAIIGLLPRGGRIVGGRILLDGRDLVKERRAELQRVRGRSVAMVFQDPMSALNPLMRVGEQIAEGPRAVLGYSRGHAREWVLDLMRRVGIPDPERRVDAYPYELSGGLRQRIMIAIALSSKPKILLCDEPTTGLDVTIQDQILKLLVKLQDEEGLSIIYVTHDLAVIAQLARRLAVMYAGRIVEVGSVRDVFAAPSHPYTLALLRCAPRADRARTGLTPIAGTPPDMMAPPSGCRFHPRCPLAVDECASGDFPLVTVGSAHATACIRWEECAQSAHKGLVMVRE
jgi:oligopeptide/dipeptide ABC transporter ATP-binding protein